MMLTNLADAVRKAGLEVVEVDGWRTRGHGGLVSVRTIVVHHTGTPATAPGDYPSLGIVRDGRPDLDGPLAQLGLGRDGTVYVIAAGVAYHAGTVRSSIEDNWHAIGIEAEHPGTGPWPQAQYDAYVRLCAALCDRYGLTADRVLGHKEVAAPAGRKVDPTFDMPTFRERVTTTIHEERDPMAEYAADIATIKTNTEKLVRMAERAREQRNTQARRLMDRVAELRDHVVNGQLDHDELAAQLQELQTDVAALAAEED